MTSQYVYALHHTIPIDYIYMQYFRCIGFLSYRIIGRVSSLKFHKTIYTYILGDIDVF